MWKESSCEGGRNSALLVTNSANSDDKSFIFKLDLFMKFLRVYIFTYSSKFGMVFDNTNDDNFKVL